MSDSGGNSELIVEAASAMSETTMFLSLAILVASCGFAAGEYTPSMT